MTSSYKAHSSVAAASARSAVGEAADAHTLADVHVSLSRAPSVRDRSGELAYGCVDWFIYATDARSAPASIAG